MVRPAGPGQAMLAPKIEARMLQELGLKATDTVLEIGTGSGYMAALMAAKAEFVYTVEIDPALVELARQNLQQAGIVNVSVDLGDGSLCFGGSVFKFGHGSLASCCTAQNRHRTCEVKYFLCSAQ